MDIKANSLYQEMQAMSAQLSGIQAGGLQDGLNPNVKNPSGAQFADMLGQAINNVNGLQKESRVMQTQFDLGDPNISLVDVMVAKEKSSIAFEATIQVRNKLLESYKTIMNMPV